MIFIPGWLISIATFPGVMVHEAAHLMFCRLQKLAVFEVVFFRFGNPAGYVVHETTKEFRSMFLVAMGPFFVNSLVCVLFCSAAFLPVRELGVADPLAYFFYWLGLSIGMHAIPSNQDMAGLWRLMPAAAKRLSPLAILSYPIVGLVYLLNFARIVWADLLYGLAIGIWAPLALFHWLV
ncbi:MAG: DUF3267 domain-containing protein [Gemmatimonadales bacterium]